MRAHALLSASSAHRWLACPPSAIAAELYQDEGSPCAAEGTLAHEVAEQVAKIAPCYTKLYKDAWPEEVTQEMLDYAKGYGDYIQEQTKTADAVMLLEQRVDFSAWVPDGFGTCDCILIEGDTLTIIDYKYGKGVAVSAIENPQMRLYALGALNDFGFAYDVDKVVTHIYQPRINNISTETLTTDELLTWANKTVKPTAAKAAKGKGRYNAGPHCKFCPHAGRCRMLTQVCTEFVKLKDDKHAKVECLAAHEVAEVLQMAPLIELWLKRVKSQALTSLLEGNEVPGFKVVEGKLGNRKWTDERKVADVLDGAGYKAEDYTETKLLSPASIDKLVGKKKAAELLADCIERAPGAPVVVPETDKRPVYDRTADFEKLEN